MATLTDWLIVSLQLYLFAPALVKIHFAEHFRSILGKATKAVPGAYWLYGLIDANGSFPDNVDDLPTMAQFPHRDMDLTKVIETAVKVVEVAIGKSTVSLHEIVKVMRLRAPLQEFSFLDVEDPLHPFFIAQVNVAARKKGVPPYTPEIEYSLPSPEGMHDFFDDGHNPHPRGRESPREALKRSKSEYSSRSKSRSRSRFVNYA